ncbi:transcriptional regulator [Ktedonosporobacter rubrisoli]|uniref:Transcriptional regulator n=1 Tax=Ktedonosporobacter rubrisoli TaxID=2509675 RepID=A0A4P6JKP5_KTERU|nr:PAS domain-containing protein [Ktedonosporobacter rubrisoli]QBD75542.1 transcriptional regulator [Ktedonosporobacter rubrisoli]
MQQVESETFLLAQVKQIAEAILYMFGEEHCEVLIHDFRQPDHPIIWIGGHLTGRHVGGAMSQIGLEMLAQGDEARARINYTVQTDDGKRLKASMVPLRNAEGQVFAALCLKFDITPLLSLEHLLHHWLSSDETSPPVSNVHYSDSSADVAQAILDDVVHQRGLRHPPLDAAGRIALMRALQQHGFFGIRRAVPILADYLQLSRASIYHYLKQVSPQQSGALLEGEE